MDIGMLVVGIIFIDDGISIEDIYVKETIILNTCRIGMGFMKTPFVVLLQGTRGHG